MATDFRRLITVSTYCITGAAALSLILFVLLVSVYGWDSKYLVVLAAGAVFSLHLWLSPPARLSATVFTLSTCVALYGANLFLGIQQYTDSHFPLSHWKGIQAGAPHLPALAQAATAMGHAFDPRSRLDVMSALRAQGIDAWPTISTLLLFAGSPDKFDEPVLTMDGAPLLPLGGISRTATVYCNESGERIVFQTDEHGFRNPPGLWSAPNIQVAVIGDSFAHGACVGQNDSFPAIIQQSVPSTISLGNDGFGPLSELATVREYLPTLKPHVVVWTYFERNDFWDLSMEKGSFLRNYLDTQFTQNLIAKQDQIDAALKGYVQTVLNGGSIGVRAKSVMDAVVFHLATRSGLEHLIKLSYLRIVASGLTSGPSRGKAVEPAQWVPRKPAAYDEVMLFRDILQEVRDSVEAWGGQLVFVYLPEFERYAIPNYFDPNREVVMDIVERLGIPMIDIDQAFRSHHDPLGLFPFRQPAHYTAEGYTVVAEAILRTLDLPRLGVAANRSGRQEIN